MPRRKAPKESSFNCLENRYKQNAKNRNIFYGLSRDDFRKLVSQSCSYCGSEPQEWNPYFTISGARGRLHRNSTDEWAREQGIKITGIDRIDSDPNIGYVMENCMPCCGQCNHMRCNWTSKEFTDHCIKVAKFQEGMKKLHE